jgi:uncharacterized membrane protein (DUF4010 family)
LRGVLLSLIVAVAAGGLIGAERQQAHANARDFGGIRTFPLVALVGAVGALLRPTFGPWLLLLQFAGVTALLVISHARGDDDPGVTSEVAALVTFSLGALAGAHELMPDTSRYLLVGSIAAMTMAILALKRTLHGFAAGLSSDDLYATAKFVVLAAVVLPTLPNHSVGPFGAINPFKIGLMTALVAGLSFAGYVAARVLGTRRGLLVTGLVGGLASSTAVTMTFAGRTREAPAIASLAAVAIIAASSTMFARVLVVIGAVDRPLLAGLLWPLGAMTVAGGGIAAALFFGDRDRARKGEQVRLRNPFELSKAVQFGILYGVVLLFAKAAQHYLGNRGVYVSSVLAGVTDIDAIILSLAEMHRGGMDAATANTAIVLAVTTNTLVKAAIATSIGGRALGVRVGGALGAALVAGLAALILTRA